MAQDIAVQSGGLQDMVDPAVAGRGPVPASGLGTFDLLALTGGAGAGFPAASLNKTEFPSVVVPVLGVDVSGDDFAGSIDMLVATGLLLKDGVSAKPFTAPLDREWVLSVTVPGISTGEVEGIADDVVGISSELAKSGVDADGVSDTHEILTAMDAVSGSAEASSLADEVLSDGLITKKLKSDEADVEPDGLVSDEDADGIGIEKEKAKPDILDSTDDDIVGMEAVEVAGLMPVTSALITPEAQAATVSDDDRPEESRDVMTGKVVDSGIRTLAERFKEIRPEDQRTEPQKAVTGEVDPGARDPDAELTAVTSDMMRNTTRDINRNIEGLVEPRAEDGGTEMAARNQIEGSDGSKNSTRLTSRVEPDRTLAQTPTSNLTNDGAFIAAESAMAQSHEHRQHERRDERQTMAVSVAQQKAKSAEADTLRADVEAALDALDGSVSASQNDRLSTQSGVAAERETRAALVGHTGLISADPSKDTADVSRLQSSQFGSPTFFGVPQTATGEQVMASRRMAVEDPMVVEMRNRAIERQVLNALKNDKNEITMTLFPAHLGEVVIKLSIDGQKVRLGFKTANRDAKDALIDSESMLKEALTNAGLVLSSLDISADRDARPHQHDAADPLKHIPPAEDQTADFSINRLA